MPQTRHLGNIETKYVGEHQGMWTFGISQLVNQRHFLKSFYVGKPIDRKWSDICLLWATAYWDPQQSIWSAQSVCFCASSYCASFVLAMTPSSHRQAGRFFLWISSKTSICILNMSKKWLPSRLLSLCVADKRRMSVYVTQTTYPRCCSPNGCRPKPESVCPFSTLRMYMERIINKILFSQYLVKKTCRNSFAVFFYTFYSVFNLSFSVL